MRLDCLLRHVSEHRISAAETDHGELGKECADAD
jgi:hypothetical protein